MSVVNRALRDCAVAPWLGLWESEYFDVLDSYHFDPYPADAVERVAALVARDLVPWIMQWPAEALGRLQASLEYDLTYDRDALASATARDTGFESCDPIAAVWIPIWSAVYGSVVEAEPADSYIVLGDGAAAAEIERFSLPDVVWPWMDQVRARRHSASWAATTDFVVVPTLEEATRSWPEPPVDLGRVLKLSWQGLHVIDRALRLRDADPEARWAPDPNGKPLPQVDLRQTFLRTLYASDAALALLEARDRQLASMAGSLTALIQQLAAAAGVLGLEVSAQSLSAQYAEKAETDLGTHRHWQTIATLAAEADEALAVGSVIVS